MERQFVIAFAFLDQNNIEDIMLIDHVMKPENICPQTARFEFNSLSEEYCYLNSRFYKRDLINLKQTLGIDSVLVCSNGTRFGRLEGLCILLRRMVYPNRYVDLMKIFPRRRCELSRIFGAMVQLVKSKRGHLLTDVRRPYITVQGLQDFANAVSRKGSPYDRSVGFPDGTVRSTCCPTHNQREYYNGHKRTHFLKFQSAMFPNGIINSMYGAVSGRRHDAHGLDESGLMEQMEERFNDVNGNPFYLYTDPDYPLRRHLIVPFQCRQMTPIKRLCNKKMSSLRESVEWGFSKICQVFAFLDFKKNLKLEMQPVSDFYLVGTLLVNCHSCFYGNQTADYFNLCPPTLQEYLRG